MESDRAAGHDVGDPRRMSVPLVAFARANAVFDPPDAFVFEEEPEVGRRRLHCVYVLRWHGRLDRGSERKPEAYGKQQSDRQGSHSIISPVDDITRMRCASLSPT